MRARLVWYRYTIGNRSVSFLRCGGIEDAIANLWAPFLRIPSGHNPSFGKKHRGRCPHRPAPAKSQLPGNPREVRTTFSAENGCCGLREPADIGCLLRNRIQNLPFRQRYADKTVHLCCRSPRGERGLKLARSSICFHHLCRSPRGERGLKLLCPRRTDRSQGRSPRGERGLKSCPPDTDTQEEPRRSPRGERGLKLLGPAGV